MSQENVETVLGVHEAWNRRDFAAAIRIADDDAELHFVGGFENLIGEEFDGPGGILRFWRDILGTIGGEVEVESAFDAGERVAVVATVRGSGAESGAPAELTFGEVWS